MVFVQMVDVIVHLDLLVPTVKLKHAQLFVLTVVFTTKVLVSVIQVSKGKTVNFDLKSVHLPTVQVMVLVSMATASVIQGGKDLHVLRVS